MSISKISENAPKFFKSSLALVATNYALRCDAKIADTAFLSMESSIRKNGFFELGDFLPEPLAKGIQPEYLDIPTANSVPVINTLSIQNLAINKQDCRHMTRDDFEQLNEERRLSKGDVLLTVDGGVSIGKAAYFDSEDDFTVDSHVCILRPKGINAIGFVYLLASPIGQMQFRRAESGATGQTSVTEEDIRRFIFPRKVLENLDDIADRIEKERKAITEARAALAIRESAIWEKLDGLLR